MSRTAVFGGGWVVMAYYLQKRVLVWDETTHFHY